MSAIDRGEQYTFNFSAVRDTESDSETEPTSNVVHFYDTRLMEERLEALARLKRNQVFDTSAYEHLTKDR